MISFPGLWTLFAMLGASCFITGFLWYKLGGSSEYRGGTIEMNAAVEEVQDGDVKDVQALNGGVSVKELGKTAGM